MEYARIVWDIISWLITTIVDVVVYVFTAIILILSIVWSFISPPSEAELELEKLQFIESRYQVDLPENYISLESYEDWFGFDYTEKVTIQYSEKQIDYIILQINDNSNWTESSNRIEFENHTKDFHEDIFIDLSKNQIYYKFIDF